MAQAFAQNIFFFHDASALASLSFPINIQAYMDEWLHVWGKKRKKKKRKKGKKTPQKLQATHYKILKIDFSI